MIAAPLLAAAAAAAVLVTPEQLARDRDVVIVEARWGAQPGDAERVFGGGHIPGAVLANTEAFENGYPRWHLRPMPELHAAIGKLGIGADSRVVVYSDRTITAARVWWILRYAGVRSVRILDGGLAGWRRAGYAVETGRGRSALRPVRFVARPRLAMLATTEDVEQAVAKRNWNLVDVRSREEFDGKVSGYSYLAEMGRIPGAVHAGNADDSAGLYQTPDGLLRPDAVESMWRRLNLGAGGRGVIFYCGGGWRSSLAALYAEIMGMERTKNYSDGWSGWSTAYERDPAFQGAPTPGWRQRPSGRPRE